MPVYNAETFVKESIESVLAQTYKNFQLICVNDCSSDNSLAVLNQSAENDSRITVIDSPINIGAGAARNLGIEAAEGEYITFVDSDDTIAPDLLERAVAICENGKTDQVVWGLLEKHYTADGKPIKTVSITPEAKTATDFDSITKMVLTLEEQTLFGYQCNSLYRAEIIKNNNIRFEKTILYEDFFFNLKFAKYMTNITALNYDGYNYFKRANTSITHGFVKNYFELSYRRISDMFEFCTERNHKDSKVYNVLGNRLLRYTLSAVSRNFKPEAEMNAKERKKWFSDICKMPLYSELLSKCKPSNIPYSIMKFAVSHKIYFPAALLGKLINLIG